MDRESSSTTNRKKKYLVLEAERGSVVVNDAGQVVVGFYPMMEKISLRMMSYSLGDGKGQHGRWEGCGTKRKFQEE